MLSKVLVAAVVLVLAAPIFGLGSLALWTDTQTVGSNTFNTSNIDISTAPTSAVWTAVTTAVPGDRATGFITVTNAGGAQLRYAITGSNTSATLAAGMNLRVALRGGASCDFPYHNTDGTNTTLTDDTQLFSGLMNVAALVGSTTQGAQAGDRTLNATASEVLCFGVVLPLSASTTLQSLNNTATYTFDAEQTTNNP